MATSISSRKRKNSRGSSIEAAEEETASLQPEGTKGHHHNIAENRLPSKKRKGSHDVISVRSRKGSHDLSVSFEDLPSRKASGDSSYNPEPVPRKLSHDSKRDAKVDIMGPPEAPNADSPVLKHGSSASALEHLEALSRPRRGSEATDDESAITFTSDGQRMLFEAMMGGKDDHEPLPESDRERLESIGRVGELGTGRVRLESWTGFKSDEGDAGRGRLESWAGLKSEEEDFLLTSARDGSDFMTKGRSDSLTRDRSDSLARGKSDSLARDRSESFGALLRDGTGRDRSESWGGLRSGGRDRLESWGAMSDLSVALGPLDSSAALNMATHAVLQAPTGEDLPALDVSANADPTTILGTEDSKTSSIPLKISVNRDRLDTVGSLSELDRVRLNSMSELSVSQLPMLMDGVDTTGDIQAYVAAAMATVGDQISDLAGAIENVTTSADSVTTETLKKEAGLELLSDASSTASPLIGAASDSNRGKRRPRTWSTSSGISVDFEAVQAAVHAAEAATAAGALDLAALGDLEHSSDGASMASSRHGRRRRQLPTSKRGRSESLMSNNSEDYTTTGISRQEMKLIRERARAAAGYIPSLTAKKPAARSDDPTLPPTKKQRLPPIKKRNKRNTPDPEKQQSSAHATPKLGSSRARKALPKTPCLSASLSASTPLPDAPPSSTSSTGRTPGGQASQKWEGMFNCLIEFIEERKEEETKTLTQEEKAKWIWDGNVPTNYKTKAGKALGRWVNNQRSAKSKGTLKEEREQRLVDSGLRWSVLAAGSWNHMLEELKIYINDQKQKGRTWDGNVPTSYQIKTRENSPFAGEDKNLGRWVNRQRSLYQAGKLRKERQKSLEAVGLKWSMLATMSWDSMCDTLRTYVQQQKKNHGKWDGNVPANYKTDDTPARALGRWINRQRSAYMKGKLKDEYVDKLNSIGLKWSVHNRQGDDDGDTPAKVMSSTPASTTRTPASVARSVSSIPTPAPIATPLAVATPAAPKVQPPETVSLSSAAKTPNANTK